MITTTMACEWGDVKIGWEDVNDPEIKAIIEKKLTEGYHFFRESDTDPEQQIRIRRVSDVKGHVIIPDRDLHELFTKGKIAIIQTEVAEVVDSAAAAGGPERLRDAEAVMRTPSIAHRAYQGG